MKFCKDCKHCKKTKRIYLCTRYKYQIDIVYGHKKYISCLNTRDYYGNEHCGEKARFFEPTWWCKVKQWIRGIK
jgi:hypothetical protein